MNLSSIALKSIGETTMVKKEIPSVVYNHMAQKSKKRKSYRNIGKNDNSTIKIWVVSITFMLAYVWNK